MLPVSYAEIYLTDETLRAFVESRIVQAGIDVQAAKVEHARDQEVIKAQQQEIADLKNTIRASKRSPRVRTTGSTARTPHRV